MKKLLSLILISLGLFFTIGCENKDEPTSPSIQFNLDPQLNKTYNFQRWLLDSLDQKREGPFFFNERCAAKNLTVGGKNDVFLSVTFHNQYTIDSTYLRVENGKDIYEWMDTLGIFSQDSKANLKFLLNKITQSYTWVPRILLSKGDGAEYVLLPKRTYPIMIDTNFVVNVSFEMIAKNEGFENVQVPAGNYKAYKVKITTKAEVYVGTQKIDTIYMYQYYWVSDDLDWWIKQFRPTVKSTIFGIISEGQLDELISVQ